MSTNVLTRQQQRAWALWAGLSNMRQDRAMRFIKHLVDEHRRTGQGASKRVLIAVCGAPDSAWQTIRADVGHAFGLVRTPPAAVRYDSQTDTYRIVEGLEALAAWVAERARSIHGEAQIVEQTIAAHLETPNSTGRGRARRLLTDAERASDAADALRRRADRYAP